VNWVAASQENIADSLDPAQVVGIADIDRNYLVAASDSFVSVLRNAEYSEGYVAQ
jgi:hypothetical protein